MILSKQVCTVEQAKRLHELGIEKHNSLFSHWPNPKYVEGGAIEPSGTYEIHLTGINRTYASAIKDSAFTVAELLVMIPYNVENRDWYMRNCWKGISFGYNGQNAGKPHIEQEWFKTDEAAKALASLLIYLLENKLVTVEDCNKRLSE